VLEKERSEREQALEKSMEELKTDKSTLQEFLTIKDQNIKEKDEKLKMLNKRLTESKTLIASQKFKYEKQLAHLKNQASLVNSLNEVRNGSSDENFLVGANINNQSI